MATELGTLIAWNASDGIGRIRLDSGEELRVGQVALGYRKLDVGRRCEVLEAEPHPLGGRKAVKVTMRDEKVAVAVEVAPPPDRSPWMRVRINTSLEQPVPSIELHGLLDAYLTFTERDVKQQVFGVDSTHLPREAWPALAAAAEEALRGWHARMATVRADAYKLDRIARLHGIDFLRGPDMTLRCEPLGSLDGLDADWVKLLEKLRTNHGMRPALECLGLQGAKKAAWGAPDLERLREAALEWEAHTEDMFPREIAALAAIADGLEVDDTPVIQTVSKWSDEDEGIQIGAGSTPQGSLTLLADGQVVDRAADRSELHRFKSLAALLAALVGP